MKFLVFHSIRLIEFKIDDLPPKKRSKYRGDVTYTGASAVNRSGCRGAVSLGEFKISLLMKELMRSIMQ
jgi:hypothetical protein